MDLPVNFPPDTRFWQLNIDEFADLPATGKLMRVDGSTVSGLRAKKLRSKMVKEGAEITEAMFRQLAPQFLAQKIREISQRLARDPEYCRRFFAQFSDEDLDLKHPDNAYWDALRNASDPEVQREAVRLLLELKQKQQRHDLQ